MYAKYSTYSQQLCPTAQKRCILALQTQQSFTLKIFGIKYVYEIMFLNIHRQIIHIIIKFCTPLHKRNITYMLNHKMNNNTLKFKKNYQNIFFLFPVKTNQNCRRQNSQHYHRYRFFK